MPSILNTMLEYHIGNALTTYTIFHMSDIGKNTFMYKLCSLYVMIKLN